MSGVMADCSLGALFKAHADEFQAIIDDLVAALKEARPYVQGTYDQLQFSSSAHIPAGVLTFIDSALAKAARS